MSTTNGSAAREVENSASDEDAWFQAARVIDPEWVELDVETQGGLVQYRIPRRTFFKAIDR